MKKLRETLIPKGRVIYFDEAAHIYTNELGIAYTSVTTIIGKYYEKFDADKVAKACEKIGRTPSHPKHHLYKYKSAKQIKAEWDATTDAACEHGSKTHNYLENAVKDANSFNKKNTKFINNRIYTIDDILEKPNFGRLKLSFLKKHGIDTRYPDIYAALEKLSKAGYYIYAEIGVYDDVYGVCGLIDILCVNHDTYDFIIVDWKTNKAPMRFDSGYYGKFETGINKGLLDLNNWIVQNKTFKHPISHLADSTGNHYTMQLSTYAYLVSTFGLTLKGMMLYHIRPIESNLYPREQWEEELIPVRINYIKNEVESMLNHFIGGQVRQTNLIF